MYPTPASQHRLSLGTQECRHHFAALADSKVKERGGGGGRGRKMSPQRQCNANCAAPRKENTSKSGIELESLPCKGHQQLIPQVLVSDIRKKKNKNRLQTKKPWTAKHVQTNFGCVLPSQSPQNHPTDLEISKKQTNKQTKKKTRPEHPSWLYLKKNKQTKHCIASKIIWPASR